MACKTLLLARDTSHVSERDQCSGAISQSSNYGDCIKGAMLIYDIEVQIVGTPEQWWPKER